MAWARKRGAGYVVATFKSQLGWFARPPVGKGRAGVEPGMERKLCPGQGGGRPSGCATARNGSRRNQPSLSALRGGWRRCSRSGAPEWTERVCVGSGRRGQPGRRGPPWHGTFPALAQATRGAAAARWKIHILLRQVDAAFRVPKTDLELPSMWRPPEERIRAPAASPPGNRSYGRPWNCGWRTRGWATPGRVWRSRPRSKSCR